MTTKLYSLSLTFITAATILTGCADSDTTTVGAHKIDPPNSEKEQYIVVLKKGGAQQLTVRGKFSALSVDHNLPAAEKIFSNSIRGGVFALTKAQVEELTQDPDVAYVEKDYVISIKNDTAEKTYTDVTTDVADENLFLPSLVQNNVTWGLDRIDQISLPLNQSYNYSSSGAIVHAYVIDTGIFTTHTDFQGRAVHGTDLVDKDSNATDCNGHGTHVAGTIGSATYGVAKNVKLYGVRVLDCQGSGRFSDVIAGIDWVTAHHTKPAVANLSLGGPASQAVDDAVKASIQAGVTYVVAAGNSNENACTGSPSRVAEALTVGSTTSSDARSSFSNYGACVDVFAPGSDIKSLWYTSSTATNTISGTSMASPHTAGVAALYLAGHPNATPAQVSVALTGSATSGRVSNSGSGSPNRLLNAIFANLEDDGGDDDDGGGDTPPSEDGRLVSGVKVKNISATKSSEIYFTIAVPANSPNLNIEILGGSGDADLYVRFGTKPTTTLYDCRPYKSGNNEICAQPNPRTGVWHVMVRAYSTYAGLSLKATASPPAQPDDCTNCVVYTGTLRGRGESNYLPPNGYQLAGGTQKIVLDGPVGTDYDLFLYKLSGANWVRVASSTNLNSHEEINYAGTAGVYRIQVFSYSGGGAYRVKVNGPG